MKKFEEQLRQFAKLAIQTGVNLQKGQGLLLVAPIESVRFTRMVAEEAYKAGAKDVHTEWLDDELVVQRYTHAPIEALENVPAWKFHARNEMVKDNYAVLNILGENPDLLEKVDGSKVAAYMKAAGKGLTPYRDYMMKDKMQWSIVAYPTVAWSKKVFPEKSVEEAQEAMMEEILRISRVTGNEDPNAAWKAHNKQLHLAADYMNKQQFTKLIYKAKGTDLSIELPKGHIWSGGSGPTDAGVDFNANIPTEEVFTMPHKNGVNGTVSSTLPYNFNGQLIEDFQLTFKDGEVVDYKAEKGQEALKNLLEADAGAKRLGEVALVPHKSPVSQSGLIFYNTLFDENASCHLALGKAYPTCIAGGNDMTAAELEAAGVNDSIMHEDFMIGSADLDIDGVKEDGTTVAVFRQGAWAFEFK
ncbi:aminopeptidase [Terribacillus saccharophilus]|jgi:aminopeptidase|uniref:Aminopeptidase n=1 Tax=Terribacillus saccharophilus TaxID=361277 RepID=A0A268HHW2_9BACI|nr:aminopeptidase [Terribacillus saccharophilus]PAD35140.1 aminopeptidase [Terribacillus saccharophilus]PAD95889.1 aminopeptidase [Terribacillus saccharophilus]PAD99787.1 aminopeptidase [Terribacillus saccharophilus]PAE09453.1 aminopeptidase [Terribacillus saccharophilus]PAF23412.1 aminopeptidase [Terribacillus saccharophilus]